MGPSQRQKWSSEVSRAFSSASSGNSEAWEIAVSESEEGRKWKLFPIRKRRRRDLWRSNERDFVPALLGLEDALLQATENINRLLESLATSDLQGTRVKKRRQMLQTAI